MIGAWTAEQRRRLSAVRTPGSEPEGFYFTADGAWKELGGQGPVPDRLSHADEKQRAHRLGLSRGTICRTFTDSYWNPLVALWLEKNGWDFVFDLVMPRVAEPWKNDLGDVSPAMSWVAIRRYLNAATPELWRQARRRVDSVLGSQEPAFAEARSYVAFAFDREPEHVHRLLRAFVDHETPCGELSVLAAAATDASLLLAAVKKHGGVPNASFVFDMAESMGPAAVPVFDLMNPVDPRARKLLAEARTIAEALAVGVSGGD